MSTIKSMKNFKQYSTRWGNLRYAHYPYRISTNGCGPTSCADIIVSNPKFKNYTPKQTRKFMINHGYVVDGAGTKWDGIAACLKWYGFKVTEHSTMPSFFKEMAKGNRRGEILFDGGSRGGVTWTKGGHFLAVSGYYTKNGKHYLKMNDPGPRNNDGWFCYETTMYGLVLDAWTAYLPEKKKKKATTKKKSEPKKDTKKTTAKKTTTKKKSKVTYPDLPKRGYFKTGDKGVNVKRLQTLLKKRNYKVGKLDGIYGDKTAKAVRDFQRDNKLTVDGIFGKQSLKCLKALFK